MKKPRGPVTRPAAPLGPPTDENNVQSGTGPSRSPCPDLWEQYVLETV